VTHPAILSESTEREKTSHLSGKSRCGTRNPFQFFSIAALWHSRCGTCSRSARGAGETCSLRTDVWFIEFDCMDVSRRNIG